MHLEVKQGTGDTGTLYIMISHTLNTKMDILFMKFGVLQQ